MTAIACWISKETGKAASIWAVGDSLISTPHQEGRGIVTEYGTKLFALPTLRRTADKRLDFTIPSEPHTFGMAYAGASIVGLNLAPALSLILTNLVGRKDSPPPSLQEIADFSGSLLQRFIIQHGSNINPERINPGCHVAIFGFCPREQRLLIFHLRPEISTEVKVDVILQPADDDAVLMIGGSVAELTKRIHDYRAQRPRGTETWWRAPLYVLKDCVEKQEFPGIGGHLQAGLADERGFRPQAIFDPFNGEEVKISKTFLGLELYDDLGNIGEHYVVMENIALPGGLVGVKHVDSSPPADATSPSLP